MVAQQDSTVCAQAAVLRLSWHSRHDGTLLSRFLLRDLFLDKAIPPPGFTCEFSIFECVPVTVESIATFPTHIFTAQLVGGPHTKFFLLPPLPPRLDPLNLSPSSLGPTADYLGHLLALGLQSNNDAKLLCSLGLRTPKALLVPTSYNVDVAPELAFHARAASANLLYFSATTILRSAATSDGLLASLRAHVAAARIASPAVVMLNDAQFLFPRNDYDAAAAFVIVCQELHADDRVVVVACCLSDENAVHPAVRNAVHVVLPIRDHDTKQVSGRASEAALNGPSPDNPLTEKYCDSTRESESTLHIRLIRQWDKIAARLGGLEEPQRVLKTVLLWRRTRSETFERLGVKPSTGVLLYGCPGTGKTALVREAAAAAEFKMLPVDAAKIARGEVGASETLLAQKFKEANKARPSVLFMDEIDAFFASGQADSPHLARLITALAQLMDTVGDDVVVVGATNRPWAISKALLRPGRFEHCVHVPLPSAVERKKIAAVYADKMVLGDVDRDCLQELAASADADGFSGADINGACRRAAMAAISRESEIETCDLQYGFGSVHASVRKADAVRVKLWQPPV